MRCLYVSKEEEEVCNVNRCRSIACPVRIRVRNQRKRNSPPNGGDQSARAVRDSETGGLKGAQDIGHVSPQ